jgi:hypothetical protein
MTKVEKLTMALFPSSKQTWLNYACHKIKVLVGYSLILYKDETGPVLPPGRLSTSPNTFRAMFPISINKFVESSWEWR